MGSSDKNINDNEKNRNIAADIFDKYGDFIYRIILSKTSDKGQVDDLYQNFFLSIISKPIDPNHKNIKSCLYHAITNDIIDASRRTKRYQKLITDYSNNFKLPINKLPSLNAYITDGEIESVLRLARDKLSPAEEKALVLRYKDNYSNEEIAKKIGAKRESVSRYICIGLKKVREMLAAKGGKKNGKFE